MRSYLKLVSTFVLAAFLLMQTAQGAFADVVLENVENGNVTIETSGDITNINADAQAIAGFSQFDIAAGHTVNVNILGLDGATADALFRINQGGASMIFGTLNVLGTLLLINQQGFNFGALSNVNVSGGGLLASTLGISNADFMAGKYALSQENSLGGYILNEGRMRSTDASFIALAGAGVRNTGSISSIGGTVAIVSGKEVTIASGNGLLTVTINQAVDAPVYDFQGNRVNDAISQDGTLSANGGLVVLSAAAKEEIFDRIINHTGIIEANSIEEKEGRIFLSGGGKGIVRVNGTLQADGKDGVDAGTIEVRGQDIEVGDGAWLSAKGKGQNSDGGEIIVFAERDGKVDGLAVVDVSGGYVSGDGGFAEISAKRNLVIDGVTVNAGAVNGLMGTVLFDPADLTISGNNFFNGGNASWQADNSITIAVNAVISTRIIAAGGDHLTANSTGNSGNITLDAPFITINSGAKLLAQGTSGFTGGDVTITATKDAVTITPFINYNDSEAKITINNAIIKGDDVNIIATSTAGRTFTDSDSAIDWGIGLLNVSGGPATLFGGGIAVAYSDAQVEVNSGSLIEGTNVKVKADAKSDATVLLLGGEGIMLGYAETVTTAKVTVNGATIKATQDVNIETFANSKTEVNATVVNLGTRGQAPLAVTFAGADSNTTSEAVVKGASSIQAGDDITVKADTHKFQNVNAAGGAYSDGVLGIGIAISQSESTTKASLGGTSTADGDIEVKATMTADKNDVAASSAAGSGLVAGLVVGGLNGAINGVANKKKPATTKDPQSQPFGLAASFAFSDHVNHVKAEIADNASAKSKGDVTVNALSSERPETSAIASVDTANMTNDTKKNVAISAAVVIGDFENNAEARIGTGATVDAKKDVTVHAEALNPYSIQWDQISGISDVLDKINPNLGVQNGLFTSWAQASATGEDVGIAGSVNILTLENNAKATIDTNANVNQDATYTTADQDVHVTADTSIETLNIAGNFGLNPVATGGAKGGIGVGYLEVDYINNTYAGIKTGANVSGETVEVAADTVTKNISIAESGGKGGQYGFNGAFSFQGIDNETVAQIDDGATIVTRKDTGDGVLVHAKDESKILNIAGGISKAGNVGIGTSVSLNEIDRDTRARIGNETGDLDATIGSVSSDSNIKVEAENTGLIGSYSLAAAIVMPDAKTPSAGNFGIGISGDVSLNKLRDNTSASIDDSNLKKATDVNVTAKAGGTIESVSGAVTINTQSGTSVGLAGSYTNNDLEQNTSAFIENSSVTADGNVRVSAVSDAEIRTINASGSGAAASGRAIAASIAANDIDNDTLAYIKNSDIKKADLVTVSANDDSDLFAVSGALGFGGKSGSGGGTANNKIESRIKAYSENSDIKASDKITLASSATGTINAYAAAIGGATSGTASGSASSDNEVEHIVEAGVKGKKSLGTRSDSDIIMTATNDSDIFNASGNISASGQSGHGRSIGINDIDNTTRVYADGARLDSKGKIDMKAESTGTIQFIGVGGTVASGQSLAASVTDNDFSNVVEAKIVGDSDVDATGNISLLASDTSDLDSLAGVLAVGGKKSIGAVVALNDIQNSIKATIDDSAVTTTGGQITVNAVSNATVDALSASGAFGGQGGINGAVSLIEIDNDVEASVKNGADLDATGKIEVKAQDTSTIRSLAGALTASGGSSLGGSAATNDIAITTKAVIDASSATSTGGNVNVIATETATIETMSVGGTFASANAVGGSVSLNDIDNSTTAEITGSSTVIANQSINVTAQDTSSIDSLAGQIAGAGDFALAGAVATNDITNTTRASGIHSTLTATNGNLEVTSTSATTIETIAVGGGGSGTASIAGSVAINNLTNTTEASLQGTDSTADDSIKVAAQYKGKVDTYAGTLSGGGTFGFGGSAVVNSVDNTTKAFIAKTATHNSAVKAKGNGITTVSKADGSAGTDSVSGLAVVAESFEDINTFTANGAAGGTGSVAATISVNLIDDDTQAYIADTTVSPVSPNGLQSVKVRSYSGADVDVKGGALSLSGTAGLGATVDTTLITNTTKAYIDNSTINAQAGGVQVASVTDEKVNSVIVSGGIAGSVGVAGSVSVVNIDGANEAYIEDSTINSTGDLKVTSDDDADITSVAGAISVGSVAGAGASVIVASIDNSTTSRLTNATTNASGVTEINADSTSNIIDYTSSGSLGGYAGVGGAITVNTISTTTQAFINETTGNTLVNQSSSFGSASQDVKVIAKDTSKIDAKDGNLSGSVAVGVGASIDVSTIRNTTTASIGNGTAVAADRDVQVKSESSKEVDSVTVSAAGGALAGVSGSVSVVNIGSAISGDGSTAASSTNSTSNNAISSGSIGTKAGSSTTANGANAKVNAKTVNLGTSDEFNQNASVSQTTTASIGNSTVIDAGGDILVDADDTTDADVLAGTIAGGFVGVGGGVAIVNLKNRANATVGTSADLSAGDDVLVTANGTVTQSDVTAVAGTAGAISLGAAYTKITSDNDATASIGNNAVVRKADQVHVLAENSSDIRAKAFGANVGSIAAGLSLAEAVETGTASASLGTGVKIADAVDLTKKVNDLIVQAYAHNYVQAYTVAASGGIFSGNGSVATAKANANTSATIGSGSDIDVENDVLVRSYSRNYADADALGVSVGGITVGVAKSYAETAPNVTASLNDSSSGAGTKINAKRDVSVIADSDENAIAYSQSAAGGAIAGNGAVADSYAGPIVKAIFGNYNEADGRDVVVRALTITYSFAQSAGVSAGALAVSASLANAVTNSLTQAYTGHFAKLRATRDALVKATANFLADGTELSNRTQSHSNASAGALVGITGTKSSLSSTQQTGTWISTGSLLKGGNNASIVSNSRNSVYANAVGKAGGLLAGGYTGTDVNVTTNAVAAVLGTGTLEAGNNANVSSWAVSNTYSNAEGGAGQDISGALSALFTGNFSASDIPSIVTIAAASGSTTVNTTASTWTEAGSTVKAGNDVDIASTAQNNIYANSYMSSTGVFVADAVAGTDVFVDSDAYTTIGGKVEAKNVRINAKNNIDITAIAQADVHADIAAGFSTAVTRVRVGDSGDPAEAKVTLQSGSRILGTVSIVIQALNFQASANLLSKAVAKAYGSFTATASTVADGSIYVNSKIQQDAGGTITTGNLAGTVNTTYQLNRAPESTASTIVTRVIEVARTVVKEVCTWLPWPLDDLCDYVTEVVFDLVTVFDFSTTNAKQQGVGVVSVDNINMNGDIFNIGGQNRAVTINADGSVTGGTGTLSGNDLILGDIVNDAQSKIRFNAEKGSITGTAIIHLKKVLDEVKIINNSIYNLVVGKINMISTNGGEPDVIYNAPTVTRYNIDSTINPAKLIIDNNGTGNILFKQAIKNYLADFTFENAGGSILADNNNVVFETSGAHLRADNGTLGSAAQRLNFRLVRADKLPDGTTNPNPAELDAFSYGDMFLDVTGVNTLVSTAACAGCTSFTFDPNYVVNSIKLDQVNTFGKADIRLNKGSLIDYKRIEHTGLTTQYDINSVTANKDVVLGGTGTILNVTGTVQSGLKDITYTIDGSNVYEHEKSDNGSMVALKDISNGGGTITLTGSLKGNGTLKALDGYSRFNLSNTTSKDVQLGVLDLDARVNKNISLGGDTNVANLEYDQVKVETFGYASSGVDINSTNANADVTIIGTVGNSTGTTTVNAVGAVFQGVSGLIKAKDIIINAGLGVGTASAFVLTDLQGGKLDVTAGGDVFLNETVGNMSIGNITTTDDVTLIASGAITDASNDGFGENAGGEWDITADSASLIVGSGIGTAANGLELRLSNFSGANTNGVFAGDGGNGGVYIANESTVGKGLTIGTLGSNSGISGKGGVKVLSGSPLDVNSDVEDTAGGDILLAALGNTAADDVTLNANVTATGGNGKITIVAGDSVSQAAISTVSAAGTGDINVFSGEDWNDATQNQDGTTTGSIVQANGARILASTGRILADSHTQVAVANLQTASNASDALTVRARNGAITDAGDTHTDIVTGTTGKAVLSATAGIGSAADSLESSIGRLDAVNTTSGDICIDELNSGSELSIDRVDQQGSGSVGIHTLGGNLTVNAGQSGVSAKSGETTLTVNGGDLIVNDTITSTSGRVVLDSNFRDVTFSSEGDVTSDSGEIEIQAERHVTQADGSVIDAGTGNIDVDATTGDVTVGLMTTMNSNSNAIDVNATLAVIDADASTGSDLVTGATGRMTLRASTGIGSANALETSTGDIDVTNTVSGNVQIDELVSGANLGINKVDQQGPGSVTVRTLDGNLTVNASQSGVSATSGEVTLSANGADNNDDLLVNDIVTTTSGKINLDSNSRDVKFSFEGDVTSTSGEVEIQAVRDVIQADGAIVNAGTGIIDVDAGRDIAVASLQTTSAATDAVVVVASTGEIRDSGDTDFDIVAQNGTTTLIAKTGIGAANALDTRMLNVSATTDTGNVQIDNTGALNIVTANGVSGASIVDPLDLNDGSHITIRTFSPLTVTGGSPVENHAGGDVSLLALGNNAIDDLTLNANVLTDGGTGNILLTSGDTTTIADGVTVSTKGTGTITVAAGEDFTDGVLNQDGNTGVGGGGIVMAPTASLLTEEGDMLLDAAGNFFVSKVDADADSDGVRGNVTTFSRAGSTLDTNGPDMNFTADHLDMTSGGSIGAPGDPIEVDVHSLTVLSRDSMYFYAIGDLLANLHSLAGNIELEATGTIILGTALAPSGYVTLIAGNSILSYTAGLGQVTALNVIRLFAGNVVGIGNNPINTYFQEPGNLYLRANGTAADGVSAHVTGNYLPFNVEFIGVPPGLAILNGIAYAGATFNFLNTSRSSLFFDVFSAASDRAARKGADFPGFFDFSRFIGRPDSIDVSAIDEISTSDVYVLPVSFAPEKKRVPAPAVQLFRIAEPKATPASLPAQMPAMAPAKPFVARTQAPVSVVAPLLPTPVSKPVVVRPALTPVPSFTPAPPAPGMFGARLFQQDIEEQLIDQKADASDKH